MVDLTPILVGVGTGVGTITGKKVLRFIFSKDGDEELEETEEVSGVFAEQAEGIVHEILQNASRSEEIPSALDGFETTITVEDGTCEKHFSYDSQDDSQLEDKSV